MYLRVKIMIEYDERVRVIDFCVYSYEFLIEVIKG